MKSISIKTEHNQISNKNLYFIADIGANHNGSLEKAIDLIKLVKESGGNAAKFQNFSADKIVSKYEFDNLKSSKTHQSTWTKSVYEVYDNASISSEWTEVLKTECAKLGLDYFTSPYDFAAVDLVDPFVDIYKIGSGDISWIDIIEYILSKKKPVIIATGASSMDDVNRVMELVENNKTPHVLMQCNTNYTGDDENFNYINLNVLTNFKNKYPETILGLSDHTSGHSTVLGAIALGARVIEKHFTDDNEQDGPDHKFAMNPNSWREMVKKSTQLMNALGTEEKKVEKNEIESFGVQRRSICVNENLDVGTKLQKNHLICLRPFKNDSFHPYEMDSVIGKSIKRNLVKGESIKTKDIS